MLQRILHLQEVVRSTVANINAQNILICNEMSMFVKRFEAAAKGADKIKLQLVKKL